METINVIIECAGKRDYSARASRNFEHFMLAGYGNTVEEAQKDFMECYHEMQELYPQECPELSFTYQLDASCFLQQFSKIISLSGMQRLTGINQKQLSRYATGMSKPTKSTTEKIRLGIERLKAELTTYSIASTNGTNKAPAR